MINRTDVTCSTAAIILSQALKGYDDQIILKWLTDDDFVVRHAAAVEMHFRPNARNFEAITAIARSPRHDHRATAIFALSQFGHPDCPFADATFPILFALFHDPYHEVRSAVFSAIGSLATKGKHPPDAVWEFVNLGAKDARPEVRCAVAESLAWFGDGRAVDVLLSLSEDEDVDVRAEASDALDIRREMKCSD